MTDFNLYDDLENFSEDGFSDVVLIIPYKGDEFKRWLIDNRKITNESAGRYVNHYMSAYERLFEIVELDLYDLLSEFIDKIPGNTGSSLTKECAVGLTECYVEAIQEELDRDAGSFSKDELRAILAYHDFIAAITGDSSLTMPKSKNLPFEDKFVDWLCDDLGMNYENAKKDASAAKIIGLLLNNLVDDESDLLESASTIQDKDSREEILATLINARGLFADEKKSPKTLQNGISALKKYFLFLNDRNK